MLEIKIRPYMPADFDSLCAIHDPARRVELALAGLASAFLPFAAASEREGFFEYPHIDVAEANGSPAAFCAYTGDELAWLYVSPGMARQGIGRRLVEKALDAEPGISHIEVLYGNEPARKLYESMGFSVQTTEEGVMPGNEGFRVRVYVMGRQNPDGNPFCVVQG